MNCRLVVTALASLWIGACSGSSESPPASTDTGLADSATDASADVPGDSAADSAVVDSASPDTTSDVSTDVGDAGDAASSVELKLEVAVGANCMPIVPADPLSVTGTLTVKNLTTGTIGPVTASFGTLAVPGGASFATYTIASIDLGTIGPGATKTGTFTKNPATMSIDPVATPICKRCADKVEVETTVYGAGSSVGRVIRSVPVPISCAL